MNTTSQYQYGGNMGSGQKFSIILIIVLFIAFVVVLTLLLMRKTIWGQTLYESESEHTLCPITPCESCPIKQCPIFDESKCPTCHDSAPMSCPACTTCQECPTCHESTCPTCQEYQPMAPHMQPNGIMGQYIMVSKVGTLHLSEIEVFDVNGVLVSRNKKVSMSSIYSNTYPESNLVDGEINNFVHTNMELVPQFVKVDLGKNYNISKIVITNRYDCCKERIEGAIVSIINDAASPALVFKSAPLKKDAVTYTFSYPFVNDMAAETLF